MIQWEVGFPPTPGARCRVCCGHGALDRLIDDLAAGPPGSPLYVVSDSNVAPLYGQPVVERLRSRSLAAELLEFPAGEAHKTRETKQRLEDRLLELGAGRDCALVAVGGGVAGDMAGFVAATWNRGVPVVQVPTTLLAMADASLGGKTAVNLGGIKNQVGAFHQPWGLYADLATLESLEESVFRDGLAEIVKTATVADPALFERLERGVAGLRAREPETIAPAIEACLRIKGAVVVEDERESGPRAALNFGHTLGHALETLVASRAGSISHGRAVSIGMSLEGRLATRKTGLPREDLERLLRLLGDLGLPVDPPKGVSVAELLAATRGDKKKRAGATRYALPNSLGRMPADVLVTVGDDEVVRALDL